MLSLHVAHYLHHFSEAKLLLHSQMKHIAIKVCAPFGIVWFSSLIGHTNVTCGYLIVTRRTGLRVFNEDNLSGTIFSCASNMSHCRSSHA